MKLYAIINKNGTPIAYHENKRVIESHLQDLDQSEFSMVRIKHPKKIIDTSGYSDLYLVKIGGGYIQSKLYDSAYILREEELYEYDSLINIIVRELEFNNSSISKEEKVALKRTLAYFEERIDEIKSEKADFESIKRFDEMRKEYNNKGYYNEY